MQLEAIQNKTTLTKMSCRREELAKIGFSYLSDMWIIES